MAFWGSWKTARFECASLPPVDGAANVAVCKVLSKALGVRRAAVRVTHGKTVRRKIVQVTGLAEADVRERLAG